MLLATDLLYFNSLKGAYLVTARNAKIPFYPRLVVYEKCHILFSLWRNLKKKKVGYVITFIDMNKGQKFALCTCICLLQVYPGTYVLLVIYTWFKKKKCRLINHAVASGYY